MKTFNEVEKILQQLPVSYYLKRKIDVKLDEIISTSQIDIHNDKLLVSYNQVKNSDVNTEQDIRCCLYHEVSHAFLTPLTLWMSDIINIFEDERIETICKDYYIDTDFKSFCKKINHYSKGMQPSNTRQAFYFVVRFRDGKQQFVNRVDSLIRKYALLNRSASRKLSSQYYNDIMNLYYDISSDFRLSQQELSSTSAQSSSNEDTDFEIDENDSVEDTSNEDTDFEIDENDSSLDNISDEVFKDAITKSLKKLNTEFKHLIDIAFQNKFKQIIARKNNFTKMNGSAINSYSGVFDSRSVGREDYKYFVQKNRLGNVKRFSKLKLNLFIDTSGSFYLSQEVVNKMLYNLKSLEKQTSDFKFDVISMGIGQKILDKDKRQIICMGGNEITSDIFTQFNKVQDNASNNINIVMFDGYAFSHIGDIQIESTEASNFKAFNHSNCMIISDTCNAKYIDRYCPSCKKVYQDTDYANKLIASVMKVLQTL